MAMKVIFGSILCIYYLIILVSGFPDGAPPEACGDMTDIVPNHNSSVPSNNDIPYLVVLSEFEDYEFEDYNGTYNRTYTPEMDYYLYLRSNDTSYTFRGFMIQARRVADDSPAGYFMINDMDYQLQCDNETAATHTNNSDKNSVNLMWVAPPAETGTIRFRYAFVMDFSTFWADLYTDPIEEADCQPLSDIINGSISCFLGPANEDICNVTCDSGYILNGSDTRTCLRNNTWSGTDGTCEPADSQEPTSATDEKSDDDGLSAGAIVGIVVGVLVGVLLLTVLVIGIYVWVSSKKAARVTKITPNPNQGESDNLMQKKEKHPMDMVSTGEDP